VLTEFLVAPPSPEAVAIVIANGPSLRGVDLSRLPKVATFGMNAAYRHWDRIGWAPTHYCCADEVVGLAHADAIGGLIRSDHGPGAFLLRRNLIEHLGATGEAPGVFNLDELQKTSRLFARHPVTTGSHSLIWAVSLGYRSIFLLGADANYVEQVEGAEPVEGPVLEIRRKAPNPNYFFDDYQRVGDRFHVPNFEGASHVRSWRVAAAVAAEAGAQVYNLSTRSRIDAFDFADLEDLMSGGALRITPREVRAMLRRERSAETALTAPAFGDPDQAASS